MTTFKMYFDTEDLLKDLAIEYAKFTLEDIEKVKLKWTEADHNFVNDKIRPIMIWQLKKDHMTIDYSAKIKHKELEICERIVKILNR